MSGYPSCGFQFLWQWLLLALLLPHPITAQRLKRGCVEAGGPITCESRYITNNLAEMEEAEAVCAKLVMEVFPKEITTDVSQHEPYLDSIKEDDPWCPKVRQYYGNCLFCGDPAKQVEVRLCLPGDHYINCGGQLPVEILKTRGDLFQSEDDIYTTCAALERVSIMWLNSTPPRRLPTTIDFCERQPFILHLCPGYCNGTCFDLESHPPSCKKDSNSSIANNSLYADSLGVDPWLKTCMDVFDRAFRWAVLGSTQLSVENQTKYLRVIQDDTHLGPNNSFCLQSREAYSHCVWCSENRCFGDHWPPSCDIPTEYSSIGGDKDIDENKICGDIMYVVDELGIESPWNVSSFEILLPDNNEFCDLARLIFHRCWWCAPHVISNWESLNETDQQSIGGPGCGIDAALPPDFESITLKSMGLTLVDPFLAPNNSQVSCDQIYQHYMGNLELPFTWLRSLDNIYLSRLCPVQFCEYEQAHTIDKNYLGATTTAQKRALIWLSRVSAILSFMGASYIIVDCLKDFTKRKLVYHQLLVGMAVFDMVTAFAWAFATLPIDKEEAGHVEGAKGNEATCMAQAFFVQLGVTSVFYNVSLSQYYLLVIAYDWREFQLQKISLYLHAIPVLLGVGLALGGLPVYHWFEYACHIIPPPEGELWVALVFVVLPLGFAIVAITVSMLLVYLKVRQRTTASNKWTLGISGASKLEQTVFWQCLFYVLAFYVSWPLLFAVYLASVDVNGPLGLTLTVAFLAPLQGFSNFIVYIRPKLIKKNKKAKSSAQKSSGTKDSAPGFSECSDTDGRKSLIRKLNQMFPRLESSLFSRSSVQRSTTANVVDLCAMENSRTRAAGMDDSFEPVAQLRHTDRKATHPGIIVAGPLFCEPTAVPEQNSPHEVAAKPKSSLRTDSLKNAAKMHDVSTSSNEGQVSEEDEMCWHERCDGVKSDQ